MKLYKNKSDWFDSDYGRVRYGCYSDMSNKTPQKFTLKLFFEDNVGESEYRQIRNRIEDNFETDIARVTSRSASNGFIILQVAKVRAFTEEDIVAIEDFIESYVYSITGLDYAYCHMYSGRTGTERISLMLTCFDWRTHNAFQYEKESGVNMVEESHRWEDENHNTINYIRSTLPEVIMSEFSNVRKCVTDDILSNKHPGTFQIKLSF